MSGHRRLGLGGSGEATFPNPPCEDNDTAYQVAEEKNEKNVTVTCREDASHACQIDVGILYCPKTCGYCSPFEYERMKSFGKPQMSLLPSVVYQTRFKEVDCHGYAAVIQGQNYNPLLTLLPAMDGKRRHNTLTCIDRSNSQSSDYALYMDCPEHTPSDRCIDGRVGMTLKHSFHGDTVYPEMLIESEKLLTSMQKAGWIDIQTDTVSVSTMIYTELVEMFTSLTVEFSLDSAGNVEGSVRMVTYRDLTRTAASNFVGYLITTCVCAFIGIVSLIVYICHNPEKIKVMPYEILSRLVLLIYPLVLLISWSQQALMSHEYELLIQSFLANEGMDEVHLQHSMAQYLKVGISYQAKHVSTS